MTKPRNDAVEIWNAGLDAVLAAPLVQREVRVEGDSLWIGHHEWSRRDLDRVIVVGAGKAATAMAEGLLASLGDWLPTIGWINVPEGTQRQLGNVHAHPARPAGVNEPTDEGVVGTKKILDLVSHASPRDLCIALISGGGSALLPAPIDGITLDDKIAVIRWLSAAGADITELNAVRKQLSRVKGGGLLRACRAGELVTLVLSDVLGDPLDLIASGPTVADSSHADDAVAVLKKFDPARTLPTNVYDVLEGKLPPPGRGDAAELGVARPDTEPNCTIVVIGNNALAVDEAGIRAEQLGYNHVMQSAPSCEGAAEEVGRQLAEMTVGMLRADPMAHRIDCLITGGEPTVKLAAAAVRGTGGRNQQLVLAAYQHLLSQQLTDGEWQRLCLLSGGTDGEDGPTDAAGAILDAEVHRAAMKQGLDANHFLERNDAYVFFQQTGGLLKTGPTGTNVCDVRVALVTA